MNTNIIEHQWSLCEPGIPDLVRRALDEDIGTGDITTRALIPDTCHVHAVIISRDNVVVSGSEVARFVFHAIDPDIRFTAVIPDGHRAKPDNSIAKVEGRANGILAGERTVLNFMQKMSGIATLTARFVEKVKPYNVTILDTRKTTPTLRQLEKYAVVCGGGCNHRMGLYDRVLIKDNHRKLWARDPGKDLAAAVAEARRKCPGIPVEVEVETESDLKNVLRASPDWILLDNIAPDQLRRYVECCDGKCRIEVSGGITLNNIEAVAGTGVDAVSLGCLTHSAPSVDLSLEVNN